jgi:hypothetical protein
MYTTFLLKVVECGPGILAEKIFYVNYLLLNPDPHPQDIQNSGTIRFPDSNSKHWLVKAKAE